MSVKRKTFYHIALFLPYFVLLISGVFTYLIRGWDVFNETTLSSLSIFAGVMIFFTIAGIILGAAIYLDGGCPPFLGARQGYRSDPSDVFVIATPAGLLDGHPGTVDQLPGFRHLSVVGISAHE